MISLLIAGGVSVAATSQTTEWPDIDNHTLRGEAIPASQVVCRNMWGTPMLPDGKGGYSLIAKINPDFIRESLIIPPRTGGMVAYRPLPEEVIEARLVPSIPVPPKVVPSPVAPAPVATEPAPADAATPAETETEAAPATDTPAF